jgi:hypothetical protein
VRHLRSKHPCLWRQSSFPCLCEAALLLQTASAATCQRALHTADGMRLHSCPGLPELGSDHDAQMLTARQQPQHLTYSAAFVRELHTFVSEQLVETMVRRPSAAASCCFCTAAALLVPNVLGIQLLHCSYSDSPTHVSPMQLLALELCPTRDIRCA